MTNFETIDQVVKYLQSKGWRGKDRKTPVSKRTLYDHIKNGFLIREKDGTFIQKNIQRYAMDFLENDFIQSEKSSIKDGLDRERLRKLQIENGIKSGEFVPLSEEIKKRVAVIQGLKSSMINSKATIFRSLRENMKKRHPDNETLNALLIDIADLYENAVLDCFDEIFKRGKV